MTSSIKLLDKDQHKNIKIQQDADNPFASTEHIISLTINEFGMAACNFPIIFVKASDTEDFRCAAMMGFKYEENLFYSDNQWKSTYLPLMVQRHPFSFIQDTEGPNPNNLSTALDEASPLVSEIDGERLYLDDGSESNVLKQYQGILADLFEGEVRSRGFITKLQELKIISACQIVLHYASGVNNQVGGIYTINQQHFSSLDKDIILELHKIGYLPAIYFMINSMGQLHRMIKYKNETADDAISHIQIRIEEV